MSEEFSSDHFTFDAIVDVWVKFLKSFQREGEEKRYYFEHIRNLQALQLKTLYLDYNDLVQASMVHDEGLNMLCRLVVHDTDEARATLREAGLQILKEVNPIYAEFISKSFRAEFMHAPIEKEMVDLLTEDEGKIIKTTGFVTEYDETGSSLLRYMVWRCSEYHYTKTELPIKPKQCKVNDCGSTVFTKDIKQSFSEDYITFKVQQRSDRTAEAKAPIILEFETIGADNVKFLKEKVKFGQYISVDGIVRSRPIRRVSGQGRAILEPYIEASYVQNLPDSLLIADDPEYIERVKFTIRHGSVEEEEEDLQKMIRSMFPSVRLPENDILRELCLLQLVGSDPWIQPDGTRIRGEIQQLVIGDPGIAKSRIAEFYKHARKRVMYNSSGKSSSVGLVGGATKNKDGTWHITSGVFGLAGDGIVILDEFAGRPDKDYSDLLEPLGDTQSITIAKGGSFRQETVNTAVLAIANAATFSRYYDVTKNIYDNTKIPTPILQRMDAIVIRKDIADPTEDEAKARHFFEMQKRSVSESDYKKGHMENVKYKDDDYYPLGYVARWLQYVRETFHPRVIDNPEAVELIIKWYLKWRKFSITISKDAKDAELGGMTIPGADMRRLASVMRFANARARACQRDYVETRDVERAIMYIELTSAEAGVWKQSDTGHKEYMKDELQSHNQLMAQKAAQRQRQKFEDVIHNLAWMHKCPTCKGSGSYAGIDEEPGLACEDCRGHGRIKQAFSKNDAITECVDLPRREMNGRSYMSGPQFQIIWDEKVKKKEIIPTDYDRYEITTPFEYKDKAGSSKIMSADEMKRQAIREALKEKHSRRASQLLKE